MALPPGVAQTQMLTRVPTRLKRCRSLSPLRPPDRTRPPVANTVAFTIESR
jgi:hypothetical protein